MSEQNELSPADLSNLPFFSNDTSPSTPQPSYRSKTMPASAREMLDRPVGSADPEVLDNEPIFQSGRDGDGWSAEYWETIAMLRDRAAEYQSAEQVNASESGARLSDEDREAQGLSTIQQVVSAHVSTQITERGTDYAWNEVIQAKARTDIFNYQYRLGRFQELIDDEDVLNIHVNGHDGVWVELANGRKEKRGPVANSDEALIEDIQFLLQKNGEGARAFDSANPDVDADLMENVRLAATMAPVTPRPSAVFRIHRYVDVRLEEMVEKGNMTASVAHLLRTAVKAECSIVVFGFGGVGKTTLLRALAAEIDPFEQVVTIEKERELHLHKLNHFGPEPYALQYHPGGESGQGQYTMLQASAKALRLNSRRQFVGEVRGDEVMAMIRAMQTGAGTFSTAHADTPEAGIDALVGLGSREYSEEYVGRQLARHIDLAVQLDQIAQPDGTKVRKVTHVTEVLKSEAGNGVGLNDIFLLDHEKGDEFAYFIQEPQDPIFVKRLRRAGLDSLMMKPGA